jgi:hypothetical protein
LLHLNYENLLVWIYEKLPHQSYRLHREGYGFSIFTKVEGLPIPQTKMVIDVHKIVTLINKADYSPKGLELAQKIYKYACESERVYEDDSFWEDD